MGFFPSFALTLVAGMLAIAVNRSSRRWLGLGQACGDLCRGSFQVLGSAQQEAKRSAGALAGRLDPEPFGEQGALSVLLAVSTAKSVLGVWRPRASRKFADIG